MKSAEIRRSYLEFFKDRGHTEVPSCPLVPGNDPTLLFTNSGMVQFKDALAGRETRDYQRATTAQRCVRAGGKHNDLENVGYTARHHTFFEMMGNFSFADYFKEETISWAWEFATTVLNLPREKLWVTVHTDDRDAARIWRDHIGLSAERIIPLGDKDNFWTMGDTGPCGHSSEIFFDHGAHVPGGLPGTPEEDGDRYVEIWNLVFPEFDLQPDGSRVRLAKFGVDTGMGLERVCAAMQGVQSNYETDVFAPILRDIGGMVGLSDPQAILANASHRVIADHIRSSAFLIADGVLPGNEDRGYVVRRIIRRALRHGHQSGIEGLFLHRLVAPLVEQIGEAYPELTRAQKLVETAIEQEELRFQETLASGLEVLERELRHMRGNVVPGDVVFKLYDTFGFPADLTADFARERNLEVDMAGFDANMSKQRDLSKAATRFASDTLPDVVLDGAVSADDATEFVGYEQYKTESDVHAIYQKLENAYRQVDRLAAGDDGLIVLAKTAFYSESGGQVGDRGELVASGGAFEVTDTQRSGDHVLHIGTCVRGEISAHGAVDATVAGEQRVATARNHSATHLMHAALREVLGDEVRQKGSLVDSARLRFDFSHGQAVTLEQQRAVERLVNAQIRANTAVATDILSYDEAIAQGAMALFGEKYGASVRVLTMGEGYSVELCGGTHVQRTGDIGSFRIVQESGVAAGVRRIEAVTGESAESYALQTDQSLREVLEAVRGTRQDVADKVRTLIAQNKQLQRELDQAKAKLASGEGSDLADMAEKVGSVSVLVREVPAADNKALMATADRLRDKLGSAVVGLVWIDNGKANVLVGLTKDVAERFSANEALAVLAGPLGAKGGGRGDMARAGGGTQIAGVAEAISTFREWIAEQL